MSTEEQINESVKKLTEAKIQAGFLTKSQVRREMEKVASHAREEALEAAKEAFVGMSKRESSEKGKEFWIKMAKAIDHFLTPPTK